VKSWLPGAAKLDVYCFDPLHSIWTFVRPGDESAPSNRIGFGLTAVNDQNNASLWVFGGLRYRGKFVISVFLARSSLSYTRMV
jgi:hypothetical protein